MKQRIYGLENEYGLIFSPNGRIYLPMEKVLGYIFEGLIPNSWPSNAFLVNGARFYQDTGCHPEYSTPECDSILDLVVHDKAGERLLEACLPAAEQITIIMKDWIGQMGGIGSSRESFALVFFMIKKNSQGISLGCYQKVK